MSAERHPRLSQEDVEILREAGLHELAEIGQRYVSADIQRHNRWYRRMLRRMAFRPSR